MLTEETKLVPMYVNNYGKRRKVTVITEVIPD